MKWSWLRLYVTAFSFYFFDNPAFSFYIYTTHKDCHGLKFELSLASCLLAVGRWLEP